MRRRCWNRLAGCIAIELALTGALAAAGYRVILALSGYKEGLEDELIRAMLSRRPDGLLLTINCSLWVFISTRS